jgi:DNA (cytosine-5)-methyltransferase 1
VEECCPRAVILENVRGLLDPVFDQYRARLVKRLARGGYSAEWRLLNASDFGVPQLRPRSVLVALREGKNFLWPGRVHTPPPTVGEALGGLMASNGWRRAASWSRKANKIAPTLVGGSKKHGGPDLGPTRARQAWAVLGVDGRGLADSPPSSAFTGTPRLTVQMTAILQGFPETWIFAGGKTAAYRQIGNAFPPPVARVLGEAIRRALATTSSRTDSVVAA